ncbi:phage tail sheath subtilisin-like domain-containing protein [Desulfuromonas acetoxidans]|uniref:phage tail sheath subtilisin-like domain-containing protein n=1 Tax=Desulfuromonas acetoxidans TaxID=891 RepID=UPI002931C4FF|nr:phage tail sheath subtilisin-like domain-containing protein [Desulfuromonas acetoxidans]
MAETFLHGVEVLEIDDGIRPITTVRSSVIGLIGTAPDADATAFPLNTPVLIAGNRTEAAKLDTVGDSAGTLPDAMDAIFDQCGAVVVVVRVDEGADETATLTNVVGGVDAGTGQYQGVQAFLAAESILGYAPKILCAPGFTSQRPDTLANPVVTELLGIAGQMRAMILADGPNTNDADAQTWASDFGSKRVYVVDPGVKVWDETTSAYIDQPASARVAGMIAKSDNERGFWWSPSNREMYGIGGTTRAIDFTLGDANSRANLLNEQNIATIINQNGYRLWGNRTLSADSKWAFLSVVRTADMINESILVNHLWAVDRNITKTYVEDVLEGVNAYLRNLKAKGAILGGECWANEELNTADQIAAGDVYFDFDFTPPYPAEHITFRSHLVDDYIKEVFA